MQRLRGMLVPARALPRYCSTATTSSPNLVLRPYQKDCLTACSDALNRNTTRIGVSLLTGSGKTEVFLTLLERLPAPPQAPEATRALVIVNRVELAQQTYDRVRKLFPKWSVEIERGEAHASGQADLTVATIQTLGKPDRLAKVSANSLKAIVVDEAHQSAARSYLGVLSHFNHAIKNPDGNVKPPVLTHRVPIIGFSGTFDRHDGLALGAVYEQIVYHKDMRDMIREKWLCPMLTTIVMRKDILSATTCDSHSGGGDFESTRSTNDIQTDAMDELVVRAWQDEASAPVIHLFKLCEYSHTQWVRIEDRKLTLVFCVDIHHVESVTAAFNTAGVQARYVHSNMALSERKRILHDFREGKIPVLVNFGILTEGVDIPAIDCIMIARPTQSPAAYAQMIGRGMRLSPRTGKKDCLLMDLVHSPECVPGLPLPTLCGEDPYLCAELKRITTWEPLLRISHTVVNDSNSLLPTYNPFDDPFWLEPEFNRSGHVELGPIFLSTNAWVCRGNQLYVLPCYPDGNIFIEPMQSCIEGDVRFAAYHVRHSADVSSSVKIHGSFTITLPPCLLTIHAAPESLTARVSANVAVHATCPRWGRQLHSD